MPIPSGTRLGSYEIVSPLGAGGMGEVYRARDTKLGREVALKVVSDVFGGDPERVARFEREAQLLASVNHPHIATIHGVETAGGTPFLVMELVEGETLATRLRGGALPVAEALRLARQIADALQAAHDKGIVHRDLKPANVALTHGDQVKVLDFGLAKLADPSASAAPHVSMSPTLSLAATQAGVILGTAAYMPPEQAKGRPTDKRADLWAFGCVLYEMLTGRRAFEGEDVTDVIAAVVRGEPDWTALPADLPAPARALLRRCLEKDRQRRIADAAVILFALDELAAFAPPAPAPAAPASNSGSSWRRAAPVAAAVLVTVALTGAAAWAWLRPEPPRLARFVVNAAPSAPLAIGSNTVDLDISRDGTRVVYVAGNPSRLHIRPVDRLETTTLTSGDGGGATSPVFSPDGNWVAYWEGGFLRKVSVLGGAPVTLTTIGAIRGVTWGPDDVVYFATNGGVLMRVPAAGGEAMPVATETARPGGRRWPHALPDGKALLLTSGLFNQGTVAVLDLQTGEQRDLVPGGFAPRYSPTGHIVYGVEGALRAVGFDLDRRQVTGNPVPVIEGVMMKTQGAVNFTLAADGTIVYVVGRGDVGGAQTIAAVDRQGRLTPLAGIPPDAYRDVRIAPDGRRLAVSTFDDIWIYDFARQTFSRLTTHAAADRSPLWTPDGERVLFSSNRAGYPQLFAKRSDGTGTEDHLLTRATDLIDLRANGWSDNGARLLFTEVPATVRIEVGELAFERPSDVKTLLKAEFSYDRAEVSPDGRWVAYNANVSGRMEVFVERYPMLGGRQQISLDGGQLPIWAPNGRELYFSDNETARMMRVAVESGATLVAGRPEVLFEAPILPVQTGWRTYDMAADGRFVIIRTPAVESSSASAPNVVLVQHWAEELKRLVPRN